MFINGLSYSLDIDASSRQWNNFFRQNVCLAPNLNRNKKVANTFWRKKLIPVAAYALIRGKKAFSLLEMTVVLIIMTIIASAIIPQMITGYWVNAAYKVAQDMSAIEEASRAYYVANNNNWPAGIPALQAGQYLPPAWNAMSPLNYTYNISPNVSTLTVSTTVPINIQPMVQNLLPLTSTSGTTISSTIAIPGSTRILPSGSIILWSGSLASIPPGWVLCNGQNGTPNLTDRFVIAAGQSYSPGQTGDGQLPTTTINFPVYTYGVNSFVVPRGSTVYTPAPATAAVLSATFGSGTQNIAVYYALAYIMKV